MRKVIIMRGLPGSGKSHYVRQLANGHAGETSDTDVQVTVCSADHFFEKPRTHITDMGVYEQPVYDFDPKLLPQAHQACMRAFVQALSEEHPVVVVDNTHVHRWEYENYVMVARLAGYDVEIVEVMPTTIEELRLCAERNRHGVPPDVVARMVMEFEPDATATVIPVKG